MTFSCLYIIFRCFITRLFIQWGMSMVLNYLIGFSSSTLAAKGSLILNIAIVLQSLLLENIT